MKIRSVGGDECLLKVIKNPITDHLPIGAHVFGTSVTGVLVDPISLVEELTEMSEKNEGNGSYVFVFGAFAHGHLNVDYVESMLSFSQYPVVVGGKQLCVAEWFFSVWKTDECLRRSVGNSLSCLLSIRCAPSLWERVRSPRDSILSRSLSSFTVERIIPAVFEPSYLNLLTNHCLP